MKRIALILILAVPFSAVTAGAGTATANLGVSASITSSCTISTTTAVAFGAYNPTAATDVTATGTLSVNCTLATAATITLGQGSNANTGSTDAAPLRRMTDGSSHFLNYSLWQDAASSVTAWGNTAGTGESYTGTGLATSVSVYGRLPKTQNVQAGSYSDTVVATVTF